MMDRKKFKEITAVFLEMEESNDIEISDEIEKRGFSKEDAERISAFFPSAFCRVAFSHDFDLHFPNEYKVQGRDGEFSYKNERIYKLAIELASDMYHNDAQSAEIFKSIVSLSAECNVVNKALNGNAEIAGAKISAVVYFGYKA